MTPEQRRAALYALPALYGVALIVGLIVGEFVWFAVIGALLLGIGYSVVYRASTPQPGQGRDRQRNRNRQRDNH
jgi:hypothetical protein